MKPMTGKGDVIDNLEWSHRSAVVGRKPAGNGRPAFIEPLEGRMLLSATPAPTPIPPRMNWSSYIGGTATDGARDVAIDAQGNIFICGSTSSSGWVSGGFNTTQHGGYDGFVVKLSPAGQPIWSTYIGGSADDYATALAIDSHGNVIVVGKTDSPAWTAGGYNTVYSGAGDGFAVKLDTNGRLVWSTYLGGASSTTDFHTGTDAANDVTVDSQDNILIAGDTDSTGWVSGGKNTVSHGQNGFVAKLDAGGAHVWSTFVTDLPATAAGAAAIVVDSLGNPIIAGSGSPWFGAGSTSGSGSWYVAKLNLSGTQTLWARRLGGSGNDLVNCLAIDGSGNVLVGGQTTSANWISGGYDSTYHDQGDGFVVKLSPEGADTLWSSYLGGNSLDSVSSIATDATGNIWVAGSTESSTWMVGGFKNNKSTHDSDAFLAKLSASGQRLWSTYVGGSSYDGGSAVAIAPGGDALLVGATDSLPDPANGWVRGGYNTIFNGGVPSYDGSNTDGFVARITQTPLPSPRIELSGNGKVIVNKDITPTLADFTDLGTVARGAFKSRVFTIGNRGNATLRLTGSPRVKITGAGAKNFSLAISPATTVKASGTTTFTIKFTARTAGVSAVTITILSDDPTRTSYSFTVRGTAK